ncbi:hypothetical protein QN277_018272 [Acacia crassicarpa]|uniref:Reverse transcriptase zinc-binding domain-containing protein n=1 Tax=Acacia crassicarpa TaxID=499986 RepID=A0AAE1MUJ6_9FABA|nr:hypothetical protein QN277_018272 [Acacia crassicarpa]
MASRITLAKSVLSSIPLYPMLVGKILKGVCQEIERIQRDFIWGHDRSSNCYHPVGWDRLTRPKEYGGLGFRRLSSFNQVCRAKLAWNLVIGSNSLWADVLLNRYMMREGYSLLNYCLGNSKLWHFISSQKIIIDRGSKWHVRNGLSVNFFNDHWLLDGMGIKELCIRQISTEEDVSLVSHWVKDGSWDFSKLADVVRPEVIQRLIVVIPPKVDASHDIIVWGATPNGKFSVKSVYFLIEVNPPNLRCNLFKHIWNWNGVECIRVFLWRVALQKLPTNEWRSCWSAHSGLCGYCNIESESILHILRDCCYAHNMWLKLLKPNYVSQFFSAGLKDWLSMNLMGKLSKDMGLFWNLIFGVAVWMLWKWSNSFAFDPNFVKPRSPESFILHNWRNFSMYEELIPDPITQCLTSGEPRS